MPSLSLEQKQSFVRDGYLVLEDVVSEATLTQAREAVWNDLEVDRDDPESWIGGGYETRDPLSEDCWSVLVEQTQHYAEALVGTDTLSAPTDRKAVHLQSPDAFPFEKVTQRRTTDGHLDGYGPGFKQTGEYNGFTIGTMVYLDDVASGGGGLTVWPGTHWVAAEYFSDHSLVSAGMGGFLPAINEDGWDYGSQLSDQLQATELTGDAGTIILWHNKLMHVAGVNQRDRIRMAALIGYARSDHEEIYVDAADKPWKYWNGLDKEDIDIAPSR